MSLKTQALICLLVILAGCATVVYKTTDFEALYGPSAPKQRVLTPEEYSESLKRGDVSYYNDVKPILDSRCAACHGCYDAPCQLKLTSFEGLDRGASKQVVYDGARLKAADPTRLFIDAANTEGWREKQFYPVLNERTDSAVANLDNSVLSKMLQLKRAQPLPESGKLADSFPLDLNRALQCPTRSEFDAYREKHPMWGMPYAMPGLSLKEEYTILAWLQAGAMVGPSPALSAQAAEEVTKWERFFNGPSLKQQLVSRYIYEHLFIGHIHFQGHPDDEFFRLVRSTTPLGQPIVEIATIRPYDDPGTAGLYYRLRPVVATIVDKTHFVYELSDRRLERYQELFFKPEYVVKALPSYQTQSASNPFKTFADIPRVSRHKFLLDDAEYFVSGFIKGPVCRGQVALNVVRDRFWIVFTDPDLGSELKITADLDRFMAEQNMNLELPASKGDEINLFDTRKFDDLAEAYLKQKDAFLDQLISEHGGLTLNAIWSGDGVNPNAALTVFRHFDSATVVNGFVGDTPLTGWVIDYSIFERIHYLLVAGFNVYGPVAHQLATRKYMDYLRIDSENNFLRFMPANRRKAMHDNWYRGVGTTFQNVFGEPLYSIDYDTGVIYKTTEYKREFFEQLTHQIGRAAGPRDAINQCDQPPCTRANASPLQQEVDRYMQKIAAIKGTQVDIFPEVSFVRVKTGRSEGDLVYTLLANRALENVAIIAAENIRRDPENDSVSVVPGFLGSYPNFFFVVAKEQLEEFVERLEHAQTPEDRDAFYSKFGIRRTNPQIWQHVDWFNAEHKKQQGEFAGLFDMNRYQNL